jgi:predicted DNA-binding protein
MMLKSCITQRGFPDMEERMHKLRPERGRGKHKVIRKEFEKYREMEPVHAHRAANKF